MQKINASIITIGDELLIGQVIDTNSAWMAQRMNDIGVWVRRRVAVGDVYEDIWKALDDEALLSDVILITGGLGPTADDITKPLLCKYFNGKMVMHEETLEHVTYLFEKVFKRPLPLQEVNRKQAEVPDTCTVLKNAMGTAPGMLFEKNGKLFISMPGVPHEMQYIIQAHVLSILKEKYILPHIAHRTLLTAGIGESMLAEKIKDFESSLPAHVKLAYLPNYGMVRLRLSSSGEKEKTENEINALFETLKQRVQEHLAVDEDIPLHEHIIKLLKQKGKTISTAESCTGGYIASLITSVAGASACYKGSVVSYDNRIKHNVLHVNNETLETFGAVSEEAVSEMIKGVLDVMQTDYAIAVSGIMGPDGGSDEKPAGTVWVAVGSKEQIAATKFHFRFSRQRNIELTAINALNMLRVFI